MVRIDLDKDLTGWRPDKGMLDKLGQEIEDRIYNQRDFDRALVLEQRTRLVAKKVSDFLKATNRFDKTIVFCDNIDHAERQALCNENADLIAQNHKYVVRITGDNEEGKMELENFIFPESRYPVIATTSKLMSTGVDAQTCSSSCWISTSSRLPSSSRSSVGARASMKISTIPLPPLPKQHRIVAKIDRLMALCDSLEQQINTSAAK
ncbi:hypothetical protein FACS189475_01460 [Betaproteobacteria bacterium]|nr:hypothetical protein FACS189475_01460 [Betaproteobacteria bacterium]